MQMTQFRVKRRGFTLIELMIVVVIIGILAAFAVPKFQNSKGKANTASLKSDLRNLATAEETYYYNNNVYTTDLNALDLRLTTGVTVTWGTVNTQGWAAKVTHPLAYPIECGLFMGNVPPIAPAYVEGALHCE